MNSFQFVLNFNEENVTTEDKDIIHLTIFSLLFEFSNESVHPPFMEISRKALYRGNISQLEDIGYVLKVFANGTGEDDAGYVSLMLCHHMNLNNFEGTCIISVIDASCNTRFSQSFIFFDEQKGDSLSVQPAVVEKYISRKTLLSDPDDLLPNDRLTLRIDIYVSTNYCCKSRLERGEWPPSSPHMVFRDRGSVVFNLNSPLGKRLAEESSFFRSILDTPMIEGKTNVMHVPEDEFKTFERLEIFLRDNEHIVFKSVKEIFDMYIIADKYDIPFAEEFSRCFLKLCLFDHSGEELLEMTEELEDDNLKEFMKEQINLIIEEQNAEDISTIGVTGIVKDVPLLKKPVQGGFWTYANYIHSLRFWFLKEKSSRTEKSIQNEINLYQKREEFLFDFYK